MPTIARTKRYKSQRCDGSSRIVCGRFGRMRKKLADDTPVIVELSSFVFPPGEDIRSGDMIHRDEGSGFVVESIKCSKSFCRCSATISRTTLTGCMQELQVVSKGKPIGCEEDTENPDKGTFCGVLHAVEQPIEVIRRTERFQESVRIYLGQPVIDQIKRDTAVRTVKGERKQYKVIDILGENTPRMHPYLLGRRVAWDG